MSAALTTSTSLFSSLAMLRPSRTVSALVRSFASVSCKHATPTVTLSRSAFPHSSVAPTSANVSSLASSSSLFNHASLLSLPARSFATGDEEKMIYSSFRVHKKNTALDFSFTRPVVVESKSGQAYSLKRNGHFLITIAPVKGENEKTYDWTQRELFAMSVVELGELVVFHKNLQQNEQKFFHENTFAQNNKNSGQVKKELIFKRQGPWKGYTITLNVTRDEQPKSVNLSVQITEGEFHVLIRLADHILPNLLAFATPTAIAPSLEATDESK